MRLDLHDEEDHLTNRSENPEQVARKLTDPSHGFLRGAKFLIHDRDPLFTEAFEESLRASNGGGWCPRRSGVASMKTRAKSPNCNPHAERFV